MTTNRPEVVAWYTPTTRDTLPVVALNDRSQRGEPLIRLSDYKALQAECEKLRADNSELRTKLAEIESQEPVYFWKEIGESDWMECGKDWYWKCADSPEHDTKLLCAKPVPADKPVTRQDVIDVLLSTRGQSEGVTADAILRLLSNKVTVSVPDAIQLLQRVAASIIEAKDE